MAYNPSQWANAALDPDNLYAFLQQHAAMPATLTLDPTRFPAAPVDNPTPPASEDSSPSPPSIKEREQFAATRAGARNTRASAAGLNEDDHSKRKQDDITDSDDSGYENMPSKYPHRASDKDGPRRSIGGTKKKGPGDENRAMKRKEQNRAAQRAFRERKERHVKELEEQVAALEAKSNNQDRENENLRDLLGRLQNENLLLKQSAFTFSFPPGGGPSNPGGPSGSAPTPSSSVNAGFNGQAPSASSPKVSSPTSSSSSASTPENTASADAVPESSLFARPSANGSQPSLGGSSIASGSSPRSEPTPSRFQMSPSAFGLQGFDSTPSNSFDFFGSAGGDMNVLGGAANLGASKNGITTISSNPMYMSFGDQSYDPMAWASFGPSDYTTGATSSPPGISNAGTDLELFSMTSFANATAPTPAATGVNTVNATGVPAFTSIDDIFGAAGTSAGPTPSFLADFGAPGSTSGTSPGGATYSTASSSIGSSIPSLSSGMASKASSATSANTSAHNADDGDNCPKTVEDVKRMQDQHPPSTFGPPVPLPNSKPSSPIATTSPTTHKMGSLSGPLPTMPSTSSSPISAPACPAPGTSSSSSNVGSSTSSNEACAHARMAALCADLPRTTKKPNQIEIGRAWEKIRQHEGFEECDIDELCNELSAKARCDGSRPVLEEASFDSIVRGLGDVHRKKSMGAGMGPVGGGGVPVPAPSI